MRKRKEESLAVRVTNYLTSSAGDRNVLPLLYDLNAELTTIRTDTIARHRQARKLLAEIISHLAKLNGAVVDEKVLALAQVYAYLDALDGTLS